MSGEKYDFDVIIAGAGPVGLTMTIDLGRRGISTMIMERDPTTAPWPKMDRSNARTMEIYRRMGIVDRVRALGYPGDNPMDVFLVRTMNEPPIATIPFPCVDEKRAQVAACKDASLPLEPYQLVAQNDLEPLLRKVAEEETPNTVVCYGLELVSFEQDESGVTVTTRRLSEGEAPIPPSPENLNLDPAGEGSGAIETFRCRYLIGCDGGRSTVRNLLDIPIEGVSAPNDLRQVIFKSDDLYEKMAVPKGRHYSFVTGGHAMVAQGSRKEFTLHSPLPADTDFHKLLRELIGFDCDIRISHVLSWRPHLRVARSFRKDRVFMAGDAVHLVIPTGGLGMNTGIGDAIDLSWKLAGTIQGWGGPELLNSYEAERRPVGIRNVEASTWAADGAFSWQPTVTREVLEFGPAGEAARARIAATFTAQQGRMHGMVGVETCYSYAGSTIVAHEPGNMPHWEFSRIVPHSRPGIRIPHMWLKDGRAMQDIFGSGYTLLDLAGDYDSAAMEAAFASIGAPLEVIRLDEPHVRETLKASVLLIRPDLHIAWRAAGYPETVEEVARVVTGHGPGYRP
ncbi:MAG: FAD-dependent monooxygenase [Betaproteobacteria bacterium]|nr:FAD-dependent monooxygenase [Betaproteobacteria bacterium]